MASSINASTSGAGGVITTADATGILNLQTAGTTAVTVDASQNVGIGTTSPDNTLEIALADNKGINLEQLGAGQTGYINWRDSDGTLSGRISYDHGTDALRFNTVAAERMRIDSGGTVIVGNNTTGGIETRTISLTGNLYSGAAAVIAKSTVNTVGSIFSQFQNLSGTAIGSITLASASSVAYNTSSDYRLKENITPMTGALDKVALLKPVTYKWKLDGSDGEGFIAHELQAIVPNAVTGEKDAVETYTDEEGNEQTRIKPQGIDTSFLVATLTAAIQEQQALITSLTARITALEGA